MDDVSLFLVYQLKEGSKFNLLDDCCILYIHNSIERNKMKEKRVCFVLHMCLNESLLQNLSRKLSTYDMVLVKRRTSTIQYCFVF